MSDTTENDAPDDSQPPPLVLVDASLVPDDGRWHSITVANRGGQLVTYRDGKEVRAISPGERAIPDA